METQPLCCILSFPPPQTGVKDVDPAVLRAALAAPVITFGSPSAVKAWVALAGLDVASTKVCACIGSTSARACEKEGLKFVYYPDSPGIEGWVDAILKGMKEHKHGSSATAAGAAR